MYREVNAIPVLIAGLHKFTRDIVVALLANDARAVVYDHVDGAPLAAEVDAAGIRLVITSTERPALSDACRALVVSRPHLRVLAFDPAARSGDRYEMQPVQIHSDVLSSDVLLEALDAAGAGWPEWLVAPS